jgi:hypothetical protein
MSLARRCLAVLLYFALLQASVLGGGSGCAAAPAHGLHRPAVAAAALPTNDVGHLAHGDGGHQDTAAAAHAAPAGADRSPSGPHGATHCGLTLGCTAAVVTARVTVVADALLRATRGETSEPGTLASVISAPGTPPPRA